MENSVKTEIETLIKNSKNAYVSSVDQEGYPNIKAMFALERDGMEVFYFSTNLSSKRTRQFMLNPKASIYFCKEETFQGLMLAGEMEVCTDRELKTRLWSEGSERYYPKGIDDDDYCVLKFTARMGNYWPKHPETFSAEDLG